MQSVSHEAILCRGFFKQHYDNIIVTSTRVSQVIIYFQFLQNTALHEIIVSSLPSTSLFLLIYLIAILSGEE
jgi:hypothetical protein